MVSYLPYFLPSPPCLSYAIKVPIRAAPGWSVGETRRREYSPSPNSAFQERAQAFKRCQGGLELPTPLNSRSDIHKPARTQCLQAAQPYKTTNLNEPPFAKHSIHEQYPKNIQLTHILLPQVNVPKTRRTYCKGKDCKKHTQHKVTQYKAGKVHLPFLLFFPSCLPPHYPPSLSSTY